MIEEDKIRRIQRMIAGMNEIDDLHLQLYGPRDSEGTAIDLQENVFAGPVYHCIACVSRADAGAREKVGYFEEQFVAIISPCCPVSAVSAHFGCLSRQSKRL